MDLLLQIGVESDLLRSHNKRWYRMEECKSETTDERTLTDACLDAERAASDANKVATTAAARQVLDDHIERDRRLADAKLLKFRVGVDRTLSRERSDYPSTNSSVAHERDSAEQRKQIERDVTDALVQQERERFDVADEARRKGQDALSDGLEARRQDTDDQLSIERQGADTSASALTEAQKKEARQREVLGVVAHDLRSPLTAICLSAENIAEATNEPLTRSTARVIELAAVRMERLISDLLDMARIESGPLRISKQRHDVGALLLEVLQSYESTFAARGITFAVDTTTDGVEAFFDYDRIVQVLSNLLGNAMKFTQSGGTVALHMERQAEMVVFIVHDNGPGIAQSALPHIFERFWTIDSDVRRGLGLGLYICQNIIQAHGGRIEAASEPNAGATFRFSLPTTQCS